jgi:hypothetical protein
MDVKRLAVVGFIGAFGWAFNPSVHATNDHDNHDSPVGLV